MYGGPGREERIGWVAFIRRRDLLPGELRGLCAETPARQYRLERYQC
jgi:hypothetical protein